MLKSLKIMILLQWEKKIRQRNHIILY